MAETNLSVRDYVYPSVCQFQKGERLRHSFYGEGSVLAVVREGNSEILVVELDDKNQTPLGIPLMTPYKCRPDFDLWRGRADILRLKYLTSTGTVNAKTTDSVGIKPVKTVGVKPADTQDDTAPTGPVGVKPAD
jgi:hypothetical protein